MLTWMDAVGLCTGAITLTRAKRHRIRRNVQVMLRRWHGDAWSHALRRSFGENNSYSAYRRDVSPYKVAFLKVSESQLLVGRLSDVLCFCRVWYLCGDGRGRADPRHGGSQSR